MASLHPRCDAGAGPGEFSVSTISDVRPGSSASERSAHGPLAPEARCEPRRGQPGDAVGAGYSGTIAFVDPQTPIVAMDDSTQVFFRRLSAPPPTTRSGLVVTAGSGRPGRRAAAGRPAERQDRASTCSTGRARRAKFRLSRQPLQRHGLRESGAGERDRRPDLPLLLHGSEAGACRRSGSTTTEQREPPGSSRWARAGRRSKRWSPRARPTIVYDTKAAAAHDGGGFAVWDANNAGPVKAVPFGPSGKAGGKKGGGGGECVPEVKVGGATVTAPGGLPAAGPRRTRAATRPAATCGSTESTSSSVAAAARGPRRWPRPRRRSSSTPERGP